MIIDLRTADYLTKVIAEIESGRGTIPILGSCSECGEHVDNMVQDIDDVHIVYQLTGDNYAVLLGCEGYWMVDPDLVGLPRGGWTNSDGLSPVNNKGYPICPGATSANPHYFCFMERRDLDECPECGHPIPDALKLNDDMTGPRT